MRVVVSARMALLAAVALMACASQWSAVSAMRCTVPAGKDVRAGAVSWWAGYKIYNSALTQDKQAFVWTTSQHSAGQYEMSTTETGPLGTTLNELKKPASNVRWIKWNDQPPAGSTSFLATPGHTKGVIASSNGRAFWLAHSWPQFADPGLTGFGDTKSRPKAVSQHFLCLSIDLTGETPEKMATHLGLIRPQIYELFPKTLATSPPDAAWATILGFDKKSTGLLNFIALDVMPLVTDAALKSENAATEVVGPKLTAPSGSACGGGASCLARRKVKAGSTSIDISLTANSVQMFASSETNQPGAFWSAFQKLMFPGHNFVIQTWNQAAVAADKHLDENVLRANGEVVKNFACLPDSTTTPKAKCLDRSLLHSKLAASLDTAFPVACVADLNAEQTRSGGALCIVSENLRTLYATHMFDVAPNRKGTSTAGAPAVDFARVDKCSSPSTTSCTIVTRVESLAEAIAYSAAHKVTANVVEAVPKAVAPRAAGNPDLSATPCNLSPSPCSQDVFPFNPPTALKLSGSLGGAAAPAVVPAAISAGAAAAPVADDWMVEYHWKKRATAKPKVAAAPLTVTAARGAVAPAAGAPARASPALHHRAGERLSRRNAESARRRAVQRKQYHTRPSAERVVAHAEVHGPFVEAEVVDSLEAVRNARISRVHAKRRLHRIIARR